MKARWWWGFLGGFLLASALAAGLAGLVLARHQVSGVPGYIKASVARKTLSVTVSATGTINASALAAADATTYGVVKAVNVKTGQKVDAGATLMTLTSGLAITAPIQGEVLAVNVVPNDGVAPGEDLVDIGQVSHLDAVVSIPESDINRVSVGQPAKITLTAVPNAAFDGIVSAIGLSGTSVQGGPVTYPVTIRIDHPHGILVGMTATAVIRMETVLHAVVVPTAAVRGSPGHYAVLIFNPEGPSTMHRIAVRVGVAASGWTQIMGNVRPGETVLIPAPATVHLLGSGSGGG